MERGFTAMAGTGRHVHRAAVAYTWVIGTLGTRSSYEIRTRLHTSFSAPGDHAQEGVIKFQLEHEDSAIDRRRYGDLACKLVAWREIMALTGLVGQDPARYDGAGYGNVSARVGAPGDGMGRRAFLITGTQTSGKRCLGLDDFSVVEQYDFSGYRIRSRGRALPSSEAMTHGAAYDLGPQIRCVLHAHTPVLWRRASELKLPTTDAKVPYGTLEMAREVQRLYRETVLPERRILAMGGHEDGILVFGGSPEDAGEVLLRWLSRAYETACGANLGSCDAAYSPRV